MKSQLRGLFTIRLVAYLLPDSPNKRATTQGLYGSIFWTLFLLVPLWVILSSQSAQAQTCNCSDYVYLNEPIGTNGGMVHKFRINPNGTFSEIFSNSPTNTLPWFPAGAGLPRPHGLGQDLNGNLYIGSNETTGPIQKLSCSGQVLNANFIPTTGYNIVSKDGYLYVNPTGISSERNRIRRYSLCDGSDQGYILLAEIPAVGSLIDWGLSLDANGTFYASAGFNNGAASRYIWRFTPTDTDFTNHTTYTAFVDNPTLNSSMRTPNEVWGITSDPAGNMYVVATEGESLTNPQTFILKYNSAGQLVASTSTPLVSTALQGFGGARGLVYYAPLNVLYLASGPTGDCISIVNAGDLSYQGAAIPNVPGQNPKTIALTTECCPVAASLKVDTTICGATVGQKIFLSQITGSCRSPICGGAWTADAGNTGIVFNQCDLSFTVTNLATACGKFTLSNTGGTCGDFNIEVKVDFASVTPPVIAGNQTVCAGTQIPGAFTAVTPATASKNLRYQWQRSTISCSDGFTDITSATAATYTPTSSLSLTTYYRVVVSGDGSCTSPNGSCTAVSNCVTVTVNPLPTVSIIGTNTVCAGQSTSLTATGAASYRWSTGATTASISVSTAGPYSVTGTSAAGCSATATTALTVTPLPDAGSAQTLVCNASGITPTSTTLTATGASSGSWSALPGNPGSTSFVNGSSLSTTVNGLTAQGTYTFVFTTPGNCSDLVTVTVPVCPCTLSLVAAATSSTVSEGQSATLTAVASVPGTYTYVWSGPAGITFSGGNTATVITSGLPSGVYNFTVTVTSQAGCTAVATTCVSVPFITCATSSFAFSLSAEAGLGTY
ncbi:hypothetical protein [uncultured Fibrella sp.]|uniref:PKD domain-containing protein n=1 Tax=uncultured Fibrella sp. TaxID=1284596 RepID=UPI0035CAB8A7